MKNVTELATKEWYILESDRWQTVGFDSPTVCSLWLVDMKSKFKSENFRSRRFLVSNNALVRFLEDSVV